MNILVSGFSAMGIVMGLTEVVKRLGLPTRFVPLFAVTTGIVIVVLISGFTGQNAITGIVLGLASSGLYSGGKAVMGK